MNMSEYNEVRSSIPRIPMPFAGYASAKVNNPSDNKRGSRLINWDEGIPPDYATPFENYGKHVLRGDINAIGNIGSRELYLVQQGGYHTFNVDVANMIGGYPYGAILDWYQPSTGWMRKVRCVLSGGNCFTPIDDIEHGIESNDPHWEIVDINDKIQPTIDIPTTYVPTAGNAYGNYGYVLKIEDTTMEQGGTYFSNEWVAPWNAKIVIPSFHEAGKYFPDWFIEDFHAYTVDYSSIHAPNPFCLQGSYFGSLYLVMKYGNQEKEIPICRESDPILFPEPTSPLYESNIESLMNFMFIAKTFFVRKGTTLKVKVERTQGSEGSFMYLKFFPEKVV